MAEVIRIHGTHAAIARTVYTDIPAVLTVKDLAFSIIVEVEGLFNLGHQPDAH